MPQIRTIKTTVVIELEHRTSQPEYVEVAHIQAGEEVNLALRSDGTTIRGMVIRSVTHDYLH